MADYDDAFPKPVSDAEAEGVPETADDGSSAYDEVLSERIADGDEPAPIPPDREDGPLGLDQYGTHGGDGLRGEELWRRLRREEPDLGPDSVRIDPDGRLAEEADPDALDQLSEDSLELAEDEPVPSRVDFETSVYDESVSGVPSLSKLGRLVQPDEGGYGDVDGDEYAYDAGAAGGGASAEESAVHIIRSDTRDGEDEPDDDAKDDASL